MQLLLSLQSSQNIQSRPKRCMIEFHEACTHVEMSVFASVVGTFHCTAMPGSRYCSNIDCSPPIVRPTRSSPVGSLIRLRTMRGEFSSEL